MPKGSWFKSLAFVALVSLSGVSQAQFTVYGSQASFLAAVTAPGTDTFAGFSVTGATSSPINRSAGAYTYTAAAPNDFFGAGTAGNPWLSTNTATDSITFSGFGGGATAIGGNFFGSDISGLFSSGSITVTATNSAGSSTQTIVGATVSSFLGFVSTLPLTSLVVSSVQPATGFLWPTVDNLTIAVSAVPEPQTYALMLAGLAVIGFAARRRKPF